MRERKTKIVNPPTKRASARPTRLSQHDCEILLGRSGRKINAKSLVGVTMLTTAKEEPRCVPN